MADFYNILGVTRGANDSELKKAYRKLAMRWHPDKNQGPAAVEAAKKFQEVAESYEVLSDPEKRAIYDQYGEEGLRNGVPDGQGGTQGGFSASVDANNIFEQFFGTSNPFADFGFGDTLPFGTSVRQTGPKKGEPQTSPLPCTLEELYNGCTKRLEVSRKRLAGNGISQVDDKKVLTIAVKPGWKKGTKITFPQEGDEAPGHLASDVVFTLAEKAHDHFKRDGNNNLIYTAKVTLAQALTECAIKVPTLDSRILSIPCNEVISPGYTKVIKGEGMPLSKDPTQKGDMHINFDISFPAYLSEEKRQKLKSLLPSDEVEEAANA
jgi:DnaJ-class molecular chaperone